MTKRSMAAKEAEIESEAETASKREGDAEGKNILGDEVVEKKKRRALISDEGENTGVSTVAANCAREHLIVNCQADHGVAILDEQGRWRRSPNKTQSHVKAAFDKLAPIERKYCHRCSRSTTRESNAESQSITKENEEESGGNLVVGKKKGWAVSSAGAGPDSPQQQLIMCCQADNCTADLLEAKRYHQKHRVCESHAKAAVVLVGETAQRYCQQCSRFHELSEFDNNKRSCRKRLAHHNERRRKAPPETKEDPERLPSVVKVKENSWRVITVSEDGGNSEVIKIALPKSPSLKHFQIR